MLGHEVRVRMAGRGAKVEIAFDDLREAQELAGARGTAGRLTHTPGKPGRRDSVLR